MECIFIINKITNNNLRIWYDIIIDQRECKKGCKALNLTVFDNAILGGQPCYDDGTYCLQDGGNTEFLFGYLVCKELGKII